MAALYLPSLIETICEENKNKCSFHIIQFYSQNLVTEDLMNSLKSRYGTRLIFSNYIYGKKNWTYFLSLIKAIKKIREIYSQFKKTKFYIAHPNHILTNYIAFHLGRSLFVEVNQIPDGIANFYNVDVKSYRVKMYVKKIISYFLGFEYHLYVGHYLGYEIDIYSKYYFLGKPYANVELNKQSLMRIPILRVKEKKGGLLILGQDVAIELAVVYMKYIDALLDRLNLQSGILYYRPHPAEIVSDEFKLFLKRHGCQLLSCDGLAEDVMVEYDHCVGFFSSALVNAKLIYGDALKLTTCDGDFIREILPFVTSSGHIELRKLFNEVGISIIDLNSC